MTNNKKQAIKIHLLDKLKEEGAFWSYDKSTVTIATIDDDTLIAEVMRHLDLPEIKILFQIYSFRKIKKAWLKLLIPEGAYLYTLNRFFAWYYFRIKNPDRYLKSMETRHFNRLARELQ